MKPIYLPLSLCAMALALSACQQHTYQAPKSLNGYTLHGEITTVVNLATITTRFNTRFDQKHYFTSIPKQHRTVISAKANSGRYQYQRLSAHKAQIIFTETHGPAHGLSLKMTLEFKGPNQGAFSGVFTKEAIGTQGGTFSLTTPQNPSGK